MRLLKTAVLLAAIAVPVLPATQASAKDKPGFCGTMKYFDAKAKKCASASKDKDHKKEAKKDKKKK